MTADSWLVLPDAADTQAFGRALGRALRAGDLVILSGSLGAGKTTLTQGIGEGLGVRGPIASPTFIIARTHPTVTGGPGLIHVDAYRLSSLAELDHLDLDTTLDDAVTVVEWGEERAEVLAADRLHVTIERPRGATENAEDAAHGARTVTLSGHGDRWDASALADVVSEWEDGTRI